MKQVTYNKDPKIKAHDDESSAWKCIHVLFEEPFTSVEGEPTEQELLDIDGDPDGAWDRTQNDPRYVAGRNAYELIAVKALLPPHVQAVHTFWLDENELWIHYQ